MSDQWGAARPPHDAGQQDRRESGQFDGYAAQVMAAASRHAGYVADPYQVPDPRQGAYAYAGAPYGEAAARQTNRVALAGVIFSVLPLLGLIFSIIGLSKASVLGGAGRTAATVGIALSLVFAGVYGLGIYKIVSSTNADPGCVAAESAELTMDRKVSADEAALSAAEAEAAESVGSSGGGSGDGGGDAGEDGEDGVQTALRAMAADLQASETELESAAAEATNAKVGAGIRAVHDDLGELIAEIEAVQAGDDSAMSSLQTVAGQLELDGNAVDQLCGGGGSGNG